MAEMVVRKAINVCGLVQGVGFRPYVWRLARERALSGRILNTSGGVSIEVQGSADRVDDFMTRLPAEAPPLARITGLAVRELPCRTDGGFVIEASRKDDECSTLIAPDVAVCADCLRELFDPADRRFHYPFINCTNCGPRFTIVANIPYDRPQTSMACFPICPACRREYDDPADRRFHAQPNACWDCGPRVELWARSGKRRGTADPIHEAASLLQDGAIVAIKGLGGFHLAVNATNAMAVARLRDRKRRVEKPFAVMADSLEAAAALCQQVDQARGLLTCPERPIVVLPKRSPSVIAEAVAPFQRTLGVFLPYTPIHHLLFAAGRFSALVMTSGNLSEEPIAIGNREALKRLRGLADFFLLHNRDILLRSDDSVMRFCLGRPRLWRRSRGYVPAPIFLHRDLPPILAVGGELKNTVCLAKGRQAFLSQHIGDLENLESYHFFKEAARRLTRILEIEPQLLAYDLHPGYLSTQWAQAQTVPQVGVQHHHAHIASCMAENQLDGEVIGFALDGTGYGTDGHIWGGEALLAGYRSYRRAAHLAYVPMPGGVAAIREPWRMAVACLWKHFGRTFLRLPIPFVRRLDPPRAEVVLTMLERGVNSPLTSSCGRLFDAVAALVGMRDVVSYEAQAAIELEAIVSDHRDQTAYPFALVPESEGWIIETEPLFEALLRDLRDGQDAPTISRRFHNGLMETFVRLAALLRRQTGLNRVCLSGGSFQNAYLLERLASGLEAERFEVFTHSEVPCGDGGLSLGQAVVAASRVE